MVVHPQYTLYTIQYIVLPIPDNGGRPVETTLIDTVPFYSVSSEEGTLNIILIGVTSNTDKRAVYGGLRELFSTMQPTSQPLLQGDGLL